MSKQVKVASHANITIKRPNGIVETVKFSGGVELNDALFARIQSATKAAGKGDVLSYVNVTKMIDQPAEWTILENAERAYDSHVASVYGAMDHAAEGG